MTDDRKPHDEAEPTALGSTESAAREAGGRIGPYRLLEKLGEGGMGQVWLAEQQSPVRRKVALKVIKRGMDSRQVVARFEAERQALALMDHAAIAKIYDAGVTPLGRPYFAMEYVRGVPITEHCDGQRLSTRQRLELFCRVCDAVQHAHQKAVIHRDLKPSNVLVSLEAAKHLPKIIDFGVAKATTQPLTEKTLHTALGTLVGTPEYMSPEQAELSGQDVDTRTDVYSLGVMLYELLVGALPFDSKELREAGLDGIRRKIREEEPAKPSTRLASLGERTTDSASLKRELTGDLDWITMRALEKERGRRYGSPAELAADIRRYLHDEPVVARPPSASYRAGKFVRRHRVGVSAAVVVVLALVAGALLAGAGFVRATRERNRAARDAAAAREVTAFLQEMLTSVKPDKARGHEVTVREILDEAAGRLEGRFEGNPEVEAALRFAVGDSYQALGDYETALPLLERAVEVRRRELGTDDPRFIDAADRLGMVHWLIGDFKGSLRISEELLEIRKRLYGEESAEYTQGLGNLANTQADAGHLETAERLLRQALAIERRTLVGERRADLSYTINNLATVLADRKQFDESIELHRESLAIRRERMGQVVVSLTNLGFALDGAGRLEEAEQTLNEALELGETVFGPTHLRVCSARMTLSAVLQEMGRLAEAEAVSRRVLRDLRDTLGEHNWRVGATHGKLGQILVEAGRVEEGRSELRLGLEILTETLGDEHERTVAVRQALERSSN